MLLLRSRAALAMGVRGDLPLRIRKVKIVGNKRTRPHVIEDELQVCPFCKVVW